LRIHAVLVLVLATWLTAACSGSSRPDASRQNPSQPEAQRTALTRPEDLSTDPPSGASPLAGGDYGIERAGETLTPTYVTRDVRCRNAGTMEVDTDHGVFLVHLRSMQQWTCDQAILQTNRSAGGNPQGLRVGLTYREPAGGEIGQLNLMFSNGGSVLYAVRGFYRAD
jgi:hypothetical protein